MLLEIEDRLLLFLLQVVGEEAVDLERGEGESAVGTGSREQWGGSLGAQGPQSAGRRS